MANITTKDIDAAADLAIRALKHRPALGLGTFDPRAGVEAQLRGVIEQWRVDARVALANEAEGPMSDEATS